MVTKSSSELIEAAKHREANARGDCFLGSIKTFYKASKMYSGEMYFVTNCLKTC